MKTLRQRIRNLTKEQKCVLTDFSKYSKNLYNYSLFVTNSYYEQTNNYIGLSNLLKEVKENENYKLLPSQSAQQIVRLVDKNYRSFFSLLKKKSRGEYSDKINAPKYKAKDSFFNVIYTYQNSKIRNNFIELYVSKLYGENKWNKKKNNSLKIPFSYNIIGKIKQITIRPVNNCQFFELIINYKEEKKENITLDKSNFLSIDLGVNNFASCISNVENSFIINGKSLKSYNQLYNKKRAKLQKELKIKNGKNWSNKLSDITIKRKYWIDNFFNQTVSIIIKHCIKNNIGTIIIGYNKKWKQGLNIGRKNNQKFYYIPYHLFKQKLKNKCNEFNISFILTEESYTSKCSFIDSEDVKKHDKYKGKRISRGLFESQKGVLINADINGAANIAKKVIDDVHKNQSIVGLMLNPIKYNI